MHVLAFQIYISRLHKVCQSFLIFSSLRSLFTNTINQPRQCFHRTFLNSVSNPIAPFSPLPDRSDPLAGSWSSATVIFTASWIQIGSLNIAWFWFCTMFPHLQVFLESLVHPPRCWFFPRTLIDYLVLDHTWDAQRSTFFIWIVHSRNRYTLRTLWHSKFYRSSTVKYRKWPFHVKSQVFKCASYELFIKSFNVPYTWRLSASSPK